MVQFLPGEVKKEYGKYRVIYRPKAWKKAESYICRGKFIKARKGGVWDRTLTEYRG